MQHLTIFSFIVLMLSFESFPANAQLKARKPESIKPTVKPIRAEVPHIDLTQVSDECCLSDTTGNDHRAYPVFINESVPVFPGDLRAFISNNLHYPDSAAARNIEGRVVLKFLIRKDGRVDSASVVRGVEKELDSAALSLINKMPPWKPGKNLDGDPIDVWYALPVTFSLE
jgi:TonB family protein